MHTSKAKQGIHSPLPIGRQVFSHLQKSHAPSHLTVTWGDKGHHSEHPLIPPSPSFILLSTTSYGMDYPVVQVRSAVSAVFPPNFLCTSSLLTGGVGWEAEKALILYKHCSAVTKTSLYYAVSSTNPKHSPTVATIKKINSIPAQTSRDVMLRTEEKQVSSK